MVNHFVNGEAVSVGGYPSDLFNPSTGAKIGSVLNAGAQELDAAAQAAHKAFGSWSAKGLGYRAEILLACRQMIIEHRDELIEICAERLGALKVPDTVYVLNELPKGPSGKIQRLKLAETVDPSDL